MLCIALGLQAARSLLGQYKLISVGGRWLRSGLQLGLATAVTARIYGLALLAVVTGYDRAEALGDVVYGCGFGLATLLAVCAGTLVAPAWAGRDFAPAAVSAGAMVPAYGYLHAAFAGGVWRPVLLWYLGTSLAGGFAAARLLGQGGRPRPIVSWIGA